MLYYIVLDLDYNEYDRFDESELSVILKAFPHRYIIIGKENEEEEE